MKALVAYFSASGVTAEVARNLAEVARADLYEIMPEVPYTTADLNWNDKNARSTVEMHNKALRPAIVDRDAHIANYDVVYLGFPIWWYVAPTIVNTFLEAYDFSGKTIVLFATSGGSGFGNTVKELRVSCPNAKIIEGGLLNGRPSAANLKKWLDNIKF